MDECSQKDRDQDLALLALERTSSRHDQWMIGHDKVHELEERERTKLRNRDEAAESAARSQGFDARLAVVALLPGLSVAIAALIVSLVR